MLIKRVYEVDPLCCPKVRRPDEGRLIHRAAPGRGDRSDIEALWFMAGVGAAAATGRRRFGPGAGCRLCRQLARISGPSRRPQELTYVDIDTFLESF